VEATVTSTGHDQGRLGLRVSLDGGRQGRTVSTLVWDLLTAYDMTERASFTLLCRDKLNETWKDNGSGTWNTSLATGFPRVTGEDAQVCPHSGSVGQSRNTLTSQCSLVVVFIIGVLYPGMEGARTL
jgi:hypothetical protein